MFVLTWPRVCRTKSRKLTKYIRLVDYILVDTLVSLAIQRTQELYETGREAPIDVHSHLN